MTGSPSRVTFYGASTPRPGSSNTAQRSSGPSIEAVSFGVHGMMESPSAVLTTVWSQCGDGATRFLMAGRLKLSVQFGDDGRGGLALCP